MVVQWLGIRLSVQGHGFDPWPEKFPYAMGNYACGLQLVSRCTLEPWSKTREATVNRSLHTTTRVAPACHNQRKPVCGNEDPAQPKISKLKK